MKKLLLTLVAIAAFSGAAQAAPLIEITEFMYNGLGAGSIGEYLELTNMGSTAINFSGWSFDDSTRTAGSQSLSAFGLVLPGQSVILTDDTAAHFKTNWGLGAAVVVIGGNSDNLGRSDEINIYDASNVLVDRLTYNDQGSGNVAGPRANGISDWAPVGALAANNASLWRASTLVDGSGSHTSLAGELGSPGTYQFAPTPVPEPSVYALLIASIGLLLIVIRIKKA
ncbi:MAG: lamin tail domain-containing protein [Chthoniobacterales bacterium]